MLLFISKRIGQTVPVVLLVSFFVFFVINVIPGDPTLTVLGEFATPEQREIARQQYGFDRPMFVQYLDWLTRTLSGDLGGRFTAMNGSGPCWSTGCRSRWS